MFVFKEHILTGFRSWFSTSTVYVPGTKLKLSGSVAKAFTCWAVLEAHASSSLDRWCLGENACKMGCSWYSNYLLKIPLFFFIVTEKSAFCPVNLSEGEKEKANHIQAIVFLLSRTQWLHNKLDLYVLKGPKGCCWRVGVLMNKEWKNADAGFKRRSKKSGV